jgi:hypothetical protein
LNGTVDIDAGFQDQLQGVWSEAAQEIAFNPIINRNGNILIQTYFDYLFFDQGANLYGPKSARTESRLPVADRLL